MIKRAIQCLFLMGVCLWPTGCANYKPVETVGGRTPIAVLPVVNQTELPQIIAPLARNVREKIAHSPNWDLVGEDEAEVTLQLTVNSFSRTALARDPGDTGRPLSYREVIGVSVEWISDLPPPWGDDPVTVVESDQILYAQPSLVNSEAGAMVEIADRLAEKIQQQLDWIRNDL